MRASALTVAIAVGLTLPLTLTGGPVQGAALTVRSSHLDAGVTDYRAQNRWQTSALAVAPDGSRVYAGGNKFVHWMDATATREISSFQLGNGWIRDMALTSDGKTLYVTSDDNVLYAASTSPAKLLWSVGVGSGPMGLALTPDGKRAYVANSQSGTVSVVDLVSRAVIASVPVGEVPWDVTVNPSGSRVFVAMRRGTGLPQIDTFTNTALNAIPIGSPSTSVAMDRSGGLIFVATDGTNDLTVVNAANGGIVARVPIGPEPTAVAVAPTGQFVYVRERQTSRIYEVAVSTFTVTKSLPTGANSGDKPEPMVIGPWGARAYYSLFTARRVVRTSLPFTGPSRPRAVKAIAGVQSARVSWSKPVSTGSGSRILRYKVTASSGGKSCTTTRLTCTVTGLQAGKVYRFSVVAFTSVGAGTKALSPRVTARYPPPPTDDTPVTPDDPTTPFD
ncbi:MAG: hypothetical protein QG597_2824 [Actinomycetota bacterium]|nr:hypothetical protein [Actinomycetota bacterium]